MFHFAPLLAADWLQVVIFLIIIVGSLAGQFFKPEQQRRKPAGRPARPRPPVPPVAAPGPPDKPPPRPRSPVQDEIETFLRRAAGQEAKQKPEVVAAEVVPPAARAGARKRTAQGKRPKPAAPPADSRESVAEHVERRMQQRGLESRRARLGDTIQAADERMESRLGHVFDEHQVGNLASATTTGRPGPATAAAAGETTPAATGPPTMVAVAMSAARITQMLRSPEDVATAVVLSEILRRPVERWS